MCTKKRVAGTLIFALCVLAQPGFAQGGGLASLVAVGAQNLYINSSTTVVGFDQTEAPCDIASVSPLTTQLSSVGMTFSGNGAIVDQCSGLIPAGAQSGTSYLALQPSTGGSEEWISFAAPQTNALLSLIGIGSVNLYAYLGESMVIEGGFVFESIDQWSQPILIEAPAFDQLVISNAGESLSPWAIDDVYATPARAVPEPQSYALLTVGLAALMLASIRRRGAEGRWF